MGYPFLCHIGDFAGEVAFYNRSHSRAEVHLMAKWCEVHPQSLVFDVGANVGFVATQLAQAARNTGCRIVAFEPVPQTFKKLEESIQALGLQDCIYPVCGAVSDRCGGVCPIAFNSAESLFAQVRQHTFNWQARGSVAWSPEVTLDAVAEATGTQPSLLKIDIEGYEAHALKGARTLLRSPQPPVICFELNPNALRQVGSSVGHVSLELSDYHLYYVDDFSGQRVPYGTPIFDLSGMDWVCNLFAAPCSVSQPEIRNLLSDSHERPR